MFDVISFDFGGTIAYEVKEEYLVYHEILEELGCTIDVDMIKKALERAREWWKDEKARTGRVWDERSRLEYVKRMLTHLNLSNIDNFALEVAKLIPYKNMVKAYDDVEPTLKELKSRGYRLIIISNIASKNDLSIYLSKLGLKQYFDMLIASGSIGYEKPNPKIFIQASKILNTPTEKMLHVGNDYKHDYLGALSAGLKSILIDRKGLYKDKQCVRISKLTELISFLT